MSFYDYDIYSNKDKTNGVKGNFAWLVTRLASPSNVFCFGKPASIMDWLHLMTNYVQPAHSYMYSIALMSSAHHLAPLLTMDTVFVDVGSTDLFLVDRFAVNMDTQERKYYEEENKRQKTLAKFLGSLGTDEKTKTKTLRKRVNGKNAEWGKLGEIVARDNTLYEMLLNMYSTQQDYDTLTIPKHLWLWGVYWLRTAMITPIVNNTQNTDQIQKLIVETLYNHPEQKHSEQETRVKQKRKNKDPASKDEELLDSVKLYDLAGLETIAFIGATKILGRKTENTTKIKGTDPWKQFMLKRFLLKRQSRLKELLENGEDHNTVLSGICYDKKYNPILNGRNDHDKKTLFCVHRRMFEEGKKWCGEPENPFLTKNNAKNNWILRTYAPFLSPTLNTKHYVGLLKKLSVDTILSVATNNAENMAKTKEKNGKHATNTNTKKESVLDQAGLGWKNANGKNVKEQELRREIEEKTKKAVRNLEKLVVNRTLAGWTVDEPFSAITNLFLEPMHGTSTTGMSPYTNMAKDVLITKTIANAYTSLIIGETIGYLGQITTPPTMKNHENTETLLDMEKQYELLSILGAFKTKQPMTTISTNHPDNNARAVILDLLTHQKTFGLYSDKPITANPYAVIMKDLSIITTINTYINKILEKTTQLGWNEKILIHQPTPAKKIQTTIKKQRPHKTISNQKNTNTNKNLEQLQEIMEDNEEENNAIEPPGYMYLSYKTKENKIFTEKRMLKKEFAERLEKLAPIILKTVENIKIKTDKDIYKDITDVLMSWTNKNKEKILEKHEKNDKHLKNTLLIDYLAYKDKEFAKKLVLRTTSNNPIALLILLRETTLKTRTQPKEKNKDKRGKEGEKEEEKEKTQKTLQLITRLLKQLVRLHYLASINEKPIEKNTDEEFILTASKFLEIISNAIPEIKSKKEEIIKDALNPRKKKEVFIATAEKQQLSLEKHGDDREKNVTVLAPKNDTPENNDNKTIIIDNSSAQQSVKHNMHKIIAEIVETVLGKNGVIDNIIDNYYDQHEKQGFKEKTTLQTRITNNHVGEKQEREKDNAWFSTDQVKKYIRLRNTVGGRKITPIIVSALEAMSKYYEISTELARLGEETTREQHNTWFPTEIKIRLYPVDENTEKEIVNIKEKITKTIQKQPTTQKTQHHKTIKDSLETNNTTYIKTAPYSENIYVWGEKIRKTTLQMNVYEKKNIITTQQINALITTMLHAKTDLKEIIETSTTILKISVNTASVEDFLHSIKTFTTPQLLRTTNTLILMTDYAVKTIEQVKRKTKQQLAKELQRTVVRFFHNATKHYPIFAIIKTLKEMEPSKILMLHQEIATQQAKTIAKISLENPEKIVPLIITYYLSETIQEQINKDIGKKRSEKKKEEDEEEQEELRQQYEELEKVLGERMKKTVVTLAVLAITTIKKTIMDNPAVDQWVENAKKTKKKLLKQYASLEKEFSEQVERHCWGKRPPLPNTPDTRKLSHLNNQLATTLLGNMFYLLPQQKTYVEHANKFMKKVADQRKELYGSPVTRKLKFKTKHQEEAFYNSAKKTIMWVLLAKQAQQWTKIAEKTIGKQALQVPLNIKPEKIARKWRIERTLPPDKVGEKNAETIVNALDKTVEVIMKNTHEEHEKNNKKDFFSPDLFWILDYLGKTPFFGGTMNAFQDLKHMTTHVDEIIALLTTRVKKKHHDNTVNMIRGFVKTACRTHRNDTKKIMISLAEKVVPEHNTQLYYPIENSDKYLETSEKTLMNYNRPSNTKTISISGTRNIITINNPLLLSEEENNNTSLTTKPFVTRALPIIEALSLEELMKNHLQATSKDKKTNRDQQEKQNPSPLNTANRSANEFPEPVKIAYYVSLVHNQAKIFPHYVHAFWLLAKTIEKFPPTITITRLYPETGYQPKEALKNIAKNMDAVVGNHKDLMTKKYLLETTMKYLITIFPFHQNNYKIKTKKWRKQIQTQKHRYLVSLDKEQLNNIYNVAYWLLAIETINNYLSPTLKDSIDQLFFYNKENVKKHLEKTGTAIIGDKQFAKKLLQYNLEKNASSLKTKLEIITNIMLESYHEPEEHKEQPPSQENTAKKDENEKKGITTTHTDETSNKQGVVNWVEEGAIITATEIITQAITDAVETTVKNTEKNNRGDLGKIMNEAINIIESFYETDIKEDNHTIKETIFDGINIAYAIKAFHDNHRHAYGSQARPSPLYMLEKTITYVPAIGIPIPQQNIDLHWETEENNETKNHYWVIPRDSKPPQLTTKQLQLIHALPQETINKIVNRIVRAGMEKIVSDKVFVSQQQITTTKDVEEQTVIGYNPILRENEKIYTTPYAYPEPFEEAKKKADKTAEKQQTTPHKHPYYHTKPVSIQVTFSDYYYQITNMKWVDHEHRYLVKDFWEPPAQVIASPLTLVNTIIPPSIVEILHQPAIISIEQPNYNIYVAYVKSIDEVGEWGKKNMDEQNKKQSILDFFSGDIPLYGIYSSKLLRRELARDLDIYHNLRNVLIGIVLGAYQALIEKIIWENTITKHIPPNIFTATSTTEMAISKLYDFLEKIDPIMSMHTHHLATRNKEKALGYEKKLRDAISNFFHRKEQGLLLGYGDFSLIGEIYKIVEIQAKKDEELRKKLEKELGVLLSMDLLGKKIRVKKDVVSVLREKTYTYMLLNNEQFVKNYVELSKKLVETILRSNTDDSSKHKERHGNKNTDEKTKQKKDNNKDIEEELREKTLAMVRTVSSLLGSWETVEKHIQKHYVDQEGRKIKRKRIVLGTDDPLFGARYSSEIMDEIRDTKHLAWKERVEADIVTSMRKYYSDFLGRINDYLNMFRWLAPTVRILNNTRPVLVKETMPVLKAPPQKQ